MKILIDWPRETRYPLSAAMEIAWFTPWYLALLPETAQLPPMRSALGLLLLTLIPLYLARALNWLGIRLDWQRAIMGVALLLTFFLAMQVVLSAGQPHSGWGLLRKSVRDSLDIYTVIPDWIVIFVTTLFLWWRGISLGQRVPSVAQIRLGFFAGLVFFVIFALAVTTFSHEDPSMFIPAFFFCSLMTMGVSRAEQIRSSRGAIRAEFGLAWMIYLSLASTLLVSLGAFVAMLLTGGGPEELQTWLAPLAVALGFVLIILSLPVVLVLALVLALAQIIGELLGGLLKDSDVQANPFQAVLEFLDNLLRAPEAQTGSPPIAFGAIRLILMLVFVALLTLVVLLLLRRLQGVRRANENVQREFIFTPDMMLKSLKEILEAGRRRLAQVADLKSGLQGLFAALSIRRIYAQMTRLAAKAGYPRQPSQTPNEYQAILSAALPELVADISQITAAYVAVHYGELPESTQTLAKVRASWHKVREGLENSPQNV